MVTAKLERQGPQATLVDGDTALMLSVRQAAQMLGVGTTLCWELVHAGQLPSVRLGRRVLIPRVAVERLAQVEGTPLPR
jgi:excisionase family DNA binding protein